ncbi:MAG: hypothetical protein WB919_16650, partial [Candidatus Sulfotelmatobacter sp.]
LCALTAARCISIYPYQIGQNNDEAIDSGAFWFYRKLGFRSGRADLRVQCEKEEHRIAADPKYRTPPRTLKRLAEAHMFYELQSPDIHNYNCGDWDTFSTRNLGLLVNRRMARGFNGDSEKIRRASTAAVTRALKIKPAQWTEGQLRSLENWSLVLALIPGLARWSADEKDRVIRIIRGKSGPSELPYLHQTRRHARLRSELLRLGSNPSGIKATESSPRIGYTFSV